MVVVVSMVHSRATSRLLWITFRQSNLTMCSTTWNQLRMPPRDTRVTMVQWWSLHPSRERDTGMPSTCKELPLSTTRTTISIAVPLLSTKPNHQWHIVLCNLSVTNDSTAFLNRINHMIILKQFSPRKSPYLFPSISMSIYTVIALLSTPYIVNQV